jgi:hypothetical protein
MRCALFYSLDDVGKSFDPIWRQWGPYLAERQWGTVREDYSRDGSAWDYFTFDMARSRVYRWGEDGIGGLSDEKARICLSLAFWNRQDPFLKERLFGLTGPQGNHSEDVKEYYYYLDATPTHSYLKMLYKYPQNQFPYQKLLQENARRDKKQPEYELIDTGVFDNDRYFDIYIEYAKVSPNDIILKITAFNRGPDVAPLDVLPHIWFRDTWSWDTNQNHEGPVHPEHCELRPNLRRFGEHVIQASHYELGNFNFYCEDPDQVLFCNNATNTEHLYGIKSQDKYFKDGINDFICNDRYHAVNPHGVGTKAAFVKRWLIPAGQSRTLYARFSEKAIDLPFKDVESLVQRSLKEADNFYCILQAEIPDADERLVQRQALAGLVWTKQFYYYDVVEWLRGDKGHPPPPAERLNGRNSEWQHLMNAEVLSMPDTWEYPWYAAWDLAFHCLPLAMIDPDFAKNQLDLITREWYMHPNGQFPAYEWGFSDVNPPVHAWAVWRVYKIDRKAQGKADYVFLERLFHKLLINFTWWVNKKDKFGRNLFQGGFLGLDNIGVFDRSAPIPFGGFINQADGTSWMGMYCLNMMLIALELALKNDVYEDIASKFFEHFLEIAGAMNNVGGDGFGLWDEEDKFYYDVLELPDASIHPLKVRSMVGLIPLFAVETLDPVYLNRLPRFKERVEWYLKVRPELAGLISRWPQEGSGDRKLLSLLRGHRMKRLLNRMLDPKEFLSDYGVRSLSKYHESNPYRFFLGESAHQVSYDPGESTTSMFGGNSNWRGPIWFPVNYLIIESLQKFHHYYGEDFKVECPTGSGNYCSLLEASQQIGHRLCSLFLKDEKGTRPAMRHAEKTANDPYFKDNVLFYEFFNGDNGLGCGASHQTGWTALVARLLQPRK